MRTFPAFCVLPPAGLFATVMDSYDYSAALEEVVPVVASRKIEAGGFWVLRPDSGDPVEVVVMVGTRRLA